MAAADVFGILLVDKPAGPTSHDVVDRIRRATGTKKVGHTGTLDPMASGLLVLCLGPATRLSQYLIAHDKRYDAQIRFGAETDTHDAQGEIVREGGPIPSLKALQEALEQFKGTIKQVPPAHSAIRVKGKRAYEKARAGENVELAARRVEIHQLEINAYEPPTVHLSIACSSGTYIRALARDLGRILDTAAHLTALRRTGVGSFSIDQAIDLEQLLSAVERGQWRQHFIPAAEALPDWPAVTLQSKELADIRHGRPVPNRTAKSGLARALTGEGELAAIIKAEEDGSDWWPQKVFIS